MESHADREVIESAFDHLKSGLGEAERAAVARTLRHLESGELRVAERGDNGEWLTHEWIKKAILLHFSIQPMKSFRSGDLQFHDRIGLRGDWSASGVRVVPGAVVREGAHVAPGAILMPCFVNIGAHIGEGTMIDTWSTVGSCAQVGRHCHISGGVGLGGVLEPLQASPVIIEDNVFIGARSEVAEGVIVREGAVLAMGCMVGQSTRLFNAMTGEVTFGEIPARAVVVPGSLPDRSGTHHVQALIIKKWRDQKTDARTELNAILR